MSDIKTPYLNGHMYEFDLCWLVEKILSFESQLNQAIDLKTIHYADPIQWDITTQYAPNTVVVDPKTGTAYMSKVPVPAGILLGNTDYWVVIFNYQEIYTKIMEGVAFYNGQSDLASKALLVHDLVWYGLDLYRVTRAIEEGGKLIPGTNLVKTSIESLLSNYYGRDRVTTLLNDTLNVSGDYTISAGDLTTNADNYVMTAEKDYHADIKGGLTIYSKDAEVNLKSSSLPILFGDNKKIDLHDLANVPYKTPEDFGAVGDGETDDTSAIQTAIDFCSANHYLLVCPKRTYKITSITVKCDILGQASFISITTDTAIDIPSSAGHRRLSFVKLSSTSDVQTATPLSNTSCGLKIGGRDNIINCDFISGFYDGVRLESNTNVGVYLNKFYISHIHNCNNLVHIVTSNKGWCNGNYFFGTEFQYNLNVAYWNSVEKICINEEAGIGSQGVDQLNLYNCFFERQIDDPVYTFTVLKGNSINSSNFIGCRFELNGTHHVMVNLTATSAFRPYGINFTPYTSQLSNKIKLNGWFNRPIDKVVTIDSAVKNYSWDISDTIKYLTDGSKAYFPNFSTRAYIASDHRYALLNELYSLNFASPLTIYITNIKKLEKITCYIDTGVFSVTLWNGTTKLTSSSDIVGNLSYDGKKYIQNIPRNILDFAINNDNINLVCIHVTGKCTWINTECFSNTAIIRRSNLDPTVYIVSDVAPTNVDKRNNIKGGDVVDVSGTLYQYNVGSPNSWN